MNQKEYMYSNALSLEKDGKFLHSLQLYEQLLDDKEMGKLAHIRVAAVYDKMGKTKSSVKILSGFLKEINNNDDEVRLFLGELMIKAGLFSEAIQNIGLISGEVRSESYFLLGLANYGLHDLNIAKINFSEFIRLNETTEYTIEAYLYLANISLMQNLLNEAVQYIEKAKEFSKDNLDIWFTAAKIYYYKEMYFHANDSIKKALKLKENDPRLLIWSAKINYQMGEFIEAEKSLNLLLEINSNDSEATAQLGLVFIKLNKIDEALVCFEKALSIDPKNQIALANKEKIENQLQVGN